jgi:hypothetical protein
MATITRKVLKGRAYFYLRECQRVDGRPRIVRQKYLGSADRVAMLVQEAVDSRGGRAPSADIAGIEKRFAALRRYLNEQGRRLLAAAEAKAIGHGGAGIVSGATGVSLRAIKKGAEELKLAQRPGGLPSSRIRAVGGGRKRTVDKDPELVRALEGLVEPETVGDPESPLRWTCKSVRRLAEALTALGHPVSHRLVADILHELEYSLQTNKKTLEGSDHPDRDEQFKYINEAVTKQLAQGEPAISVDTKKKELIGPFKNGGRELHKKGSPEKVKVHDFIIKEKGYGRVSPYGIYDMGANLGWVNVGIDHDTSSFAVESIRRWWNGMGSRMYPKAAKLLITADCGGSNGARVRLWKVELQKLASELGFPITVHHLPPGTSKWNKIEHRLFSAITQNWRGKPLVSHEVIVNLIAATTTTRGLKVECHLDENLYPKGQKVRNETMNALKLEPHTFHGNWNYDLLPV